MKKIESFTVNHLKLQPGYDGEIAGARAISM